MAFFKSLKRAFGFDSEDIDDDFTEGIDATVTPLKERLASASADLPATDEGAAPPAAEATDGAVTPPDPDRQRLLLFRQAVRLINESLPGFLSQALDAETQERYLLDALDEGMKQYLAELESQARRDYDDRWAREKTELDGRFESMREKLRKGEEDGAEAKNRQLSAERQKRALSERVHELEKQLDSLQAENEQYVLENKSLVNKLRVSAVQGDQAAATNELSQAMVNDLQSIASEARKSAQESAARLEEVTKALDQARVDAEAARAEAATLREKADRTDIEGARVAELEGQLADAREKLKVVKEIRAQIGELEQARNASDRDMEALRAENAENSRIIDDLRSDITRKNTALAQRDTALQQLSAEAATRDARVAELETALAVAKDEKHRLEDLTDSLRKTIETNLHHQAQSEALLRSEIDRLKARTPVPAPGDPGLPDTAATDDQPTPRAEVFVPEHDDFMAIPAEPEATAPRRQRRQRKSGTKPEVAAAPADEATEAPAAKNDDKPRISAIDESLDSTNWLIATPPASRKAKTEAEAAAADNEFGYKEPARRQPPENPAQMLLW